MKRILFILTLLAVANSLISMTERDHIKEAIAKNDIQLTETLLKDYAIDPNELISMFGLPVFFNPCLTIEMIELLIDNRLNIHAISIRSKTNVLWYVCRNINQYSSKFLDFYLKKGVNPKALDTYDNSCLFHELARSCFNFIDDNNLLENVNLLLHAIPDMMNTLDINGQTPTDIACKKQSSFKCPRLIALFRKHGGLTAQELLKEKMILLLHNDTNIGDLSMLPRDVRKCIVEYMMLHFKPITSF